MESTAPPAPSAPAPTTRFNRRTGTKNFSIYEDKRLFLILQQVLPKHYSDWQKVYDSYNLNKPEDFRERSVDSLHNRFRNLLKKTSPNGNKAVPANVRFAREIQRKILNRPIIDDDIETRTASRAQSQSEVAIERDDASGLADVPQSNSDGGDHPNNVTSSTQTSSNNNLRTDERTSTRRRRSHDSADTARIARNSSTANDLRTRTRPRLSSLPTTASRPRLNTSHDPSAPQVNAPSNEDIAVVLNSMWQKIQRSNLLLQQMNLKIQQQNLSIMAALQQIHPEFSATQ